MDLEGRVDDSKRARARRNQRTFHMRKQAKADSLDDRNTMLEVAVGDMNEEFLAFVDRLLQSNHIAGQPQLLVDLRKTTQRFLEIAGQVEALTDVIEDETSRPEISPRVDVSKNLSQQAASVYASPILPSPTSKTSPLYPDPGLTSLSGWVASFAAGMPNSLESTYAPVHEQNNTQSTSATGRFSPRFGYGVLPSSSSSSTNALSSTFRTAYMIGKRNSFATQLYLDGIETVWRVVRGDIHYPGLIPSCGRYRMRHEPPDVMMRWIESQLLTMRFGVIKPIAAESLAGTETPVAALPQHDYDTLQPVIRSSVSDLIREGGKFHDWLDPWDSQQHLKEHWGLGLTANSLSIPPTYLGLVSLDPSAPSDTPVGRVQHGLTIDSRTLIQKLILEQVTLGDGPRFAKYKIDEAVQSFLVETLGAMN